MQKHSPTTSKSKAVPVQDTTNQTRGQRDGQTVLNEPEGHSLRLGEASGANSPSIETRSTSLSVQNWMKSKTDPYVAFKVASGSIPPRSTMHPATDASVKSTRAKQGSAGSDVEDAEEMKRLISQKAQGQKY